MRQWELNKPFLIYHSAENKDSFQQQIRFYGNIFGNKCCRCNEGPATAPTMTNNKVIINIFQPDKFQNATLGMDLSECIVRNVPSDMCPRRPRSACESVQSEQSLLDTIWIAIQIVSSKDSDWVYSGTCPNKHFLRLGSNDPRPNRIHRMMKDVTGVGAAWILNTWNK